MGAPDGCVSKPIDEAEFLAGFLAPGLTLCFGLDSRSLRIASKERCALSSFARVGVVRLGHLRIDLGFSFGEAVDQLLRDAFNLKVAVTVALSNLVPGADHILRELCHIDP